MPAAPATRRYNTPMNLSTSTMTTTVIMSPMMLRIYVPFRQSMGLGPDTEHYGLQLGSALATIGYVAVRNRVSGSSLNR